MIRGWLSQDSKPWIHKSNNKNDNCKHGHTQPPYNAQITNWRGKKILNLSHENISLALGLCLKWRKKESVCNCTLISGVRGPPASLGLRCHVSTYPIIMRLNTSLTHYACSTLLYSHSFIALIMYYDVHHNCKRCMHKEMNKKIINMSDFHVSCSIWN